MRVLASVALAATLALGLTAPANAHASPTVPYDTYVVSDQPRTLPEGIDVTQDGRIYVGTIFGGVHGGDVKTPALHPLGTDPMTFGTHVDRFGRVWVAAWDQVLVLDADGTLLARLMLPADDVAAGAAANDLVITNKAVYVTDMNAGHLYTIDLRGQQIGTLTEFLSASDLGLDPSKVGWNGIVATPNGRTLIVSALTAGQLYRIDVATREASLIDVGRPFGADGMELRGSHTLYAVLNEVDAADRGVYVVDLNRDYTAGEVVARTTGSMFDYPTTLALYKHSVFVVNGQFDAWPGTPPYTVTVIPDPCRSTSAC